MDPDLQSRQKVEIEFWRDSPDEKPEADSLRVIISKMSEAAVFLSCLDRHDARLARSGRVLELGGGQGWASCVYKRLFPGVEMITSDISEYAVASAGKWERLLGVTLDARYACTSYEIPEPDRSIDQVFCFAAAHHFAAHRRTLLELARVLKPGGRAYYFYEPATPGFFYRLAYWRVNRKRPEVPEDVLVVSTLKRLAAEARLEVRADYHPSVLHRGGFETLYFQVLKMIPWLQRLLPSTVNLVFEKRELAG